MAIKPAVRIRKAEAPAQSPPRYGFLIHDVSRLRRTVIDQRMKPLGITRSQWWVLGHLSRNKGDPMSQVQLARLLDVGKATLGGLIDRLQRTGYVERELSEDDKRIKQVAVTPKGREFLSVMEAVGRQIHHEATVGISEAELRTFEDVLVRMKANLVALARDRSGE